MIRVAVIGFGLGGGCSAPLVATTPGMRIASIVTGDPERQAQAKARYPEAEIVSRAEDLWDAAGAHDLVVITTPNRFHGPLAVAALDAGLPVVIDKPIAPTSAEADAVVPPRASRLLLSVFQNRRGTATSSPSGGWWPTEAGPVVRFRVRFERWRLERSPARRELGAPEEAGGLLYDLGSHLHRPGDGAVRAPTQVCPRRATFGAKAWRSTTTRSSPWPTRPASAATCG